MVEFRAEDGIEPDAPLVISETIDGEAIIMHHGTGKYFDTSGSGAVIWQAIEAGASMAAAAMQLARTYDLDDATATGATTAFVATLAEHGLVRRGTATAALPPAVRASTPYAPPQLGSHDDLADMLLLDPIHDVDESGWPAARHDRAA